MTSYPDLYTAGLVHYGWDAPHEASPGDLFVDCPKCGFRFDAVHTDADGGYSCANCGLGEK